MSNAYVLILGAFLLAGVVVMAWGWSIIATARRTLRWPQVEGLIEQSDLASEEDELLPLIRFSYTVNGELHRSQLEFPAGTTPTPEFSDSYIKRYRAGTPVVVFYNPAKVQEATLEPGLRQGDWMVFALGVIATVSAILFLLFGS